MANFSSFRDFAGAMEKLVTEVDRDAKSIVARAMTERAQAIAQAAASSDLGGDPKFSGWKPPLDTHIKSIPTGSVLLPTASGAGPWTVAEFGRNNGGASGFHGPGVSRKTGKTSRTKSGGLRKVSATKGGRWNGVTQGKHTASDAVAKMEVELPKIAEAGVKRIMVRHVDVN